MAVSWTGVAGAESYRVYRGEGLNACQLGKVIIAETSELSFTDTGLRERKDLFLRRNAGRRQRRVRGPDERLRDGRPRRRARPSTFTTAPPSAAEMAIPSSTTARRRRSRFPSTTSATANLTNVRIVGVTAVTHPQSTILTALPAPIAASLLACTTTGASFEVEAEGLTYDGESDFLVEVTADELGGEISSRILRVQDTESDLDPVTLLQVPDSHSDDCSLPPETVAAEAVAVDAGGNGVLEVGENAIVSPTWANTGLAPVDQTGTASAFTGPAGPSYDLTDPCRRVRALRSGHIRLVHRLLRGLDHRGQPSVHALGRVAHRVCIADRDADVLGAARGGELLGRAVVVAFLFFDRERAAQRRDGRMRGRDDVLSFGHGDAAADGGVPAEGEGRSRVRASGVRDGGVYGRAVFESVCAVGQRAVRARGDGRMRGRDDVLSDGRDDAAADGGVSVEDGGGVGVRASGVRDGGVRRRAVLEPVCGVGQRACGAGSDGGLRRERATVRRRRWRGSRWRSSW